MNLLECIVGLGIGMMVLAPMLKITSTVLIKQSQLERATLELAEQDRMFTLMGRAIRMAGYRDPLAEPIKKSSATTLNPLTIRKAVGFNTSDELIIHHGLQRHASKKAGAEVDYDCSGNPLIVERTQQGLVRLGFSLDRQTQNSSSASGRHSRFAGSLMCESFDRQGRAQKTTLMTGIEQMRFYEIAPQKIQVELILNKKTLARTFSRRNAP